MSTTNHSSKLKTYVICSGIRYGLGEDKFFDIFTQAWRNVPEELVYYGKGENIIPVVHMIDLIKDIHSVILNVPE